MQFLLKKIEKNYGSNSTAIKPVTLNMRIGFGKVYKKGKIYMN